MSMVEGFNEKLWEEWYRNSTGKPSEDACIKELRRLGETLVSLMDDPQPGLLTWNEMVAKTIHRIAQFKSVQS